MEKCFIDKEVLSYIAVEGIKWNFTTDLAPWQGEFYERLVSMVKRCLWKATGWKHFTLEQVLTLLTKIEAILNSRPLTYVYKDFESGFVFTPSHFLVMNEKLGLPAIDDEYFKDADNQPDKSSTTRLLEGWKKGQKHLNLFCKIWREEYLFSLREKLPLQGRQNQSGCSGFGRTSFSQGKNKIPFLQKANNKQKC